MIHILERKQVLVGKVERIWEFFSDPRNLQKITPPALGFEIRSKLPAKIYEGLMIEYRVRPLFGIPVPWLTEITHVREPWYFVDEQRVGPYAVWHHEHILDQQDQNHVLMTDRVHYVLPFAPVSEVVHSFLVERKLRQIFDYRREVIAKMFGDGVEANKG